MISFRKLIPLFLVSVMVSAVISFTASTFMGAYETTVELMETGAENLVIIYGAGSRSPQTSVIPLSLYDELRRLDGVELVSPEVVSAAIARDKVIIVRGVDSEVFPRISRMRLIEGSVNLDSSISALAGRRLASSLGLKVGDFLLLRSAFSNSFLEVRISGIYESESPLDDELLTPIYVAQWLRGLPRDLVSLIRVKIDPERLSREDLASYLGGEKKIEEKPSPPSESPIIRLLTIPRARKYVMEYAVKSPEESMKSFLERNVKVNEAAIWSIVATVIFGSALLVYLASSLTMTGHARELMILRGLGASKRKLTFFTLIFIISSSIAFGLLGFGLGILLSNSFSEASLIIVGPYSVRPAFTHMALALTIGAVALIAAVSAKIELESILRGEYWRV